MENTLAALAKHICQKGVTRTKVTEMLATVETEPSGIDFEGI